jgi:hypothetical protein
MFKFLFHNCFFIFIVLNIHSYFKQMIYDKKFEKFLFVLSFTFFIRDCFDNQNVVRDKFTLSSFYNRKFRNQ